MQFIEQKIDGSFSLNESTAKHLQQICGKKQIHVIVVVGQYRTGKSFLLNRLCGQNEFKTSSTVNSQTKGIFVGSELIDDKFLLVDVEGSGATDVATQHDINIFVLSLLIANVFVFNCVGAITTASLEQLQLVTNVSELITRGSQTFASRRPKMVYLARDFSLQLQDRSGNALSSRQYLDNALSEKKEVQKSIKDLFLSSDFASIPTPHNVANLELMRPSSKLDNNFESKLSVLRTMLFQQDTEGTSVDIMLTSARHAIQAINSGRVPTLSDTWTACSQLVEAKAKFTMIAFLQQKLTTIPVTPAFFQQGVNFVYETVDRYIGQLLTPPTASDVVCTTREFTDIVVAANTLNTERCLHAVHHGVDQIRQLLNSSSDEKTIDIESIVAEHVKFCPELVTPIISVIYQHSSGSRTELARLQKLHGETTVKHEETLALLQQAGEALKKNQEEHDTQTSELQASAQKLQEEHDKAIHELTVTKQELEETESTRKVFEEDVTSELVTTKRCLQQEKAQTLESTQKLVDVQQLLSCATAERDALNDQLSTAVRSMRSRVENMQSKMKTDEAEMILTKEQLITTEQQLSQAKQVCGEQKEVLANVVVENKSSCAEHEQTVSSLKQSLSAKTTELAVIQTKLNHADERWSRKRRRAETNVDHSVELSWLKTQHNTDRNKINEVTAQLVAVRKELLEAKVAKLLF
jgi:hypothetical protein